MIILLKSGKVASIMKLFSGLLFSNKRKKGDLDWKCIIINTKLHPAHIPIHMHSNHYTV